MSKEQMKYGLLGTDESTTAEKLAKFTGEVDWGYLRPHFETGVLYFVDPELAIENVGQEISGDNKEQILEWLAAGDLVQIEALHAQQWEDTKTMFRALVVSPFVLCQLLPLS